MIDKKHNLDRIIYLVSYSSRLVEYDSYKVPSKGYSPSYAIVSERQKRLRDAGTIRVRILVSYDTLVDRRNRSRKINPQMSCYHPLSLFPFPFSQKISAFKWWLYLEKCHGHWRYFGWSGGSRRGSRNKRSASTRARLGNWEKRARDTAMARLIDGACVAENQPTGRIGDDMFSRFDRFADTSYLEQVELVELQTGNTDPKTNFRLIIIQTDLERIKFLVRSFLRTRIAKVFPQLYPLVRLKKSDTLPGR